jgi:hypothetical protein
LPWTYREGDLSITLPLVERGTQWHKGAASGSHSWCHDKKMSTLPKARWPTCALPEKKKGATIGAPFHFKLVVQQRLLQGAADVGEHIVGVRPNQPDGADDDYQDHSQHYRVFGDILTTLIIPKVL